MAKESKFEEVDSDDGQQLIDGVEQDPVELEEDTFGMAVCAIVRDAYFVAFSGKACFVRLARLLISFSLLILTLFIQVFLCIQIKLKVSAKAVHSIRNAYDFYEREVYGNATGHLFMTRHGHWRGKPEFWPGEQQAETILSNFTLDMQTRICSIPLTQPVFTGSILFIWTLICVNEFRKCLQMFISIIIQTGTASSMRDALEKEDEDDPDSKEMVIANLTPLMKLLLTIIVFLPRATISIGLLWLGCRWLFATTSFEDLILNAMALEFILLMKETVYAALMPARNRLDLASTKIIAFPKIIYLSQRGTCQFLVTIGWALVCFAWVYFYMSFLQDVLVDYNYDVHEPCKKFIETKFSV